MTKKVIDDSNLGHLVSKAKAAFWPKEDVINVNLADVATSGDYNDLSNKPTIPDVSNFITKSVNDLTNYYLKSETYTKEEVAALIGAIQQFHYEIAASISAVTSPANNVLYLIGPTGSGADKYEEYVYDATKPVAERWIKIGDTSIDLSGYITTQALNTALSAYTTTQDLTTLLADKQDTIDVQHKLDYSLIANTPTIPPADYVAMIDITSSVDESGNVNVSAAIVSGTFAEIDAALLAQKTVLLIGRYPNSPVSYQYFRCGEHRPAAEIVFTSTGGGEWFRGLVTAATWYPAANGGPERVIVDDASGILSLSPMGDGNAVTSIEKNTLLPIAVVKKDKTFVDTAEQSLTDAQKAQARTNIGAGSYSKPSGGIPASDIASGVIPAAPVNADWNASSGLAQILNKPTIPAAQVNSDWNATSGLAQILNKPTIPAAQVPSDWNATEGVSRILNKPTVPTTYAGSPTAGGFANKAVAIPFGQVDAGSTATKITATVDNFPETLTDGVCAYIRNNVISSASGWTLNINGTGEKPVYNTIADATRVTTVFNNNSTYLFVYNSSRVEGGCWDIYYGYNVNDNTVGYILRTNAMSLPTTSACYRYRLLFTSADKKHFVPANSSSSINATAKRTTTQTPIDPFGSIRYYGSTSRLSSGANPGAGYLWEQYAIPLGYSFNRTGAELTLTALKPVYIKCAPQADGSAIIDAEEPYVQELPTTADGKIYIYLGVTTSAIVVEMTYYHPVYYYDGTRISVWPGPIIGDIQTALDAIIGKSLIEFTVDKTTYQAEEDMTWEDWVDSEYNTDGWSNEHDNLTNRNYIWKSGGRAIKYNDSFVLPTDTIYNNTNYTTSALITED